uniref:(California timema) hypothetical protein n=1 Tax=Timema californicum TaxID=61474 RepID=A0A7R9J0D8_TIMCA|nr:unnamed protein product [Timema californicum]
MYQRFRGGRKQVDSQVVVFPAPPRIPRSPFLTRAMSRKRWPRTLVKEASSSWGLPTGFAVKTASGILRGSPSVTQHPAPQPLVHHGKGETDIPSMINFSTQYRELNPRPVAHYNEDSTECSTLNRNHSRGSCASASSSVYCAARAMNEAHAVIGSLVTVGLWLEHVTFQCDTSNTVPTTQHDTSTVQTRDMSPNSSHSGLCAILPRVRDMSPNSSHSGLCAILTQGQRHVSQQQPVWPVCHLAQGQRHVSQQKPLWPMCHLAQGQLRDNKLIWHKVARNSPSRSWLKVAHRPPIARRKVGVSSSC